MLKIEKTREIPVRLHRARRDRVELEVDGQMVELRAGDKLVITHTYSVTERSE